jgi:uncharacterized membrane protein
MAQTDQHVNAVHDHHGNSVAAWVSVIVLMLGSLLCAIAVAVGSLPVAIVGIVVIVGGVVAGKVLQLAGYGISGKSGR